MGTVHLDLLNTVDSIFGLTVEIKTTMKFLFPVLALAAATTGAPIQDARDLLPAGGLQHAYSLLPAGGLQHAYSLLPAGGLQPASSLLPAGGLQDASSLLPAGGLQDAPSLLPAGGLCGPSGECITG